MNDEITPKTCAHIVTGGVCVFGTRQWSPAITPPPARCAGCPGEGNPAPDEIKGLVARLEGRAGRSDRLATAARQTDDSGGAGAERDDAALLRQAASLLTLSDEARVRAEGERDEALRAIGDVAFSEIDGPWDWLATQHSLELDWAEIEEGEAAWRVHQVNGGRNDREWTLIATGETPLEAVRKAQALILRAEGEGSSVAESAAPVASQPGCSAAQSLDGKGEP